MLEFSRWTTLTAGAFLLLVSGTIYLFPVYSSDLAKELGYTDGEIAVVGTCINAGTWFSFFVGMFYDAYGARKSAILASALCCGSLLAIVLASIHAYAVPFYVVGFFGFLMGQGSGLAFTVAFQTNMKNFDEKNHGRLSGFLVCCFGLCSGTFTTVYQGFFGSSNTSDFLLSIILSQAIALVVSFVVMNELPATPVSLEKCSKRNPSLERQSKINSMALSMCNAYMMFVAFALGVSSLLVVFEVVKASPLVTVCVILLYSPLLLLPVMSGEWIMRRSSSGCFEKSSMAEALLVESDDVETSSTTSTHNTDAEMDASVPGVFMRLDFWLVFLLPGVGIGTTIMVLDNLPTLVVSRHAGNNTQEVVNALSAIFSVTNTIGRLVNGFLMDFMRPYAGKATQLSVILLGSAIGILALALAYAQWMLYVGVGIAGFSYGGTMAILAAMCVEFFGRKHLGAIWGMMGMAPAIVVSLFNNGLASTFISHYEIDKSCKGIPECLLVPLYSASGACLLCCGCCYILAWARRKAT